jgi:mycothiol synthase
VRLPEGYSVRPATEDDLEQMASVANAYDVVDFGRPDTDVEHLRDAWSGPRFEAERDSWLVLAHGGRVAAFGLVEPTPGPILESFGRVHPEHRGLGIGTFLVAAMEGRAAERPGTVMLHNGVTSTDAAALALLEGRGYQLLRFFWHMERDLARDDLGVPAVPEGLQIQPASESDERATWVAIDEAFRDHWSWSSEPFEEWLAMARSGGDRILLAVDGVEIAGVITVRPMTGIGWIDELAVRRPWRGRGLGEALLRSAFAHLAELGLGAVRLNVDADNKTGATRLYERVGMRVRREWLVYEKRFEAEGGGDGQGDDPDVGTGDRASNGRDRGPGGPGGSRWDRPAGLSYGRP